MKYRSLIYRNVIHYSSNLDASEVNLAIATRIVFVLRDKTILRAL